MLHIAVDVDCAGEEIHGQVSDGVQAPKPFSGWLGLIGVLDTMMGSARQDPATASAGTSDSVRSVKRGGER